MKRIKKNVLALCAFAIMLVSLPTTQVSAATVVTTTYHQTDARNLAAKVNEFRTGKDAWHWDKNFIKHHTSYGVYTDFMGEDLLVSHGGPFPIESIYYVM